MQEIPEKSDNTVTTTDHETDATPPQRSEPSLSPRKTSRWVATIATLALLFVLAALAGLVYLWQEGQEFQEKNDKQWSQLTQTLGKVQLDQRQQSAALLMTQHQMQQVIAKTEEKTQDWQLHEAEYLVRLAMFNLNFDNNILLAKQLLQNADERLKDLASPDIIKVRAAFASDIASLQTITPVDAPGIILKINAIGQQIAALPRVPQPKQLLAATPTKVNPEAKTADWLGRIQEVGEQIWLNLKNLVVIHYNAPAAAPLLPPDYYPFVVANIQTQLSMAQWAVLHQQEQIYQASLQQAIDWVTQYYAGNQGNIANVVTQLNALKAMTIRPTVPNLANSLNAIQKLTTTE